MDDFHFGQREAQGSTNEPCLMTFKVLIAYRANMALVEVLMLVSHI